MQQPRAWELYRALADDDVSQLREFVARGLDVNSPIYDVGCPDADIQELLDNLRARSAAAMRRRDVAFEEWRCFVAWGSSARGIARARRTYEAARREADVTSLEFCTAEEQLGLSDPEFEGREALPLNIAAGHGRDAAVMVLLEAGADLQAEDFWGNTVLSWEAVSVGSYFRPRSSIILDNSSIACLLAAGADVNSVNDQGQSPLTLAIGGPLLPDADETFLADQPAWLVSQYEENPIDYASRKLIKILLRAGATLTNPRDIFIAAPNHKITANAILEPIEKAGGWTPWVSKHRRILSSFVSKCAPLPVDVAGHVVDFVWPAGGW